MTMEDAILSQELMKRDLLEKWEKRQEDEKLWHREQKELGVIRRKLWWKRLQWRMGICKDLSSKWEEDMEEYCLREVR